MTKEEIYKKLELYSRIKFKKKNELAEKMEINPGNLRNLFYKMNKNENVNFETVLNLAEALDLEIILQEKK